MRKFLEMANIYTLLTVMFVLAYFGYMLGAFVIDLRIDWHRDAVVAMAVREGTARGVEAYKEELKRSRLNETMLQKKREARDEAIRKYIKHLDSMMDFGGKPKQ